MPDAIIAPELEWTPIREGVTGCIFCINFNPCSIIGHHMASTTRGEFKFRCPVLGQTNRIGESECNEPLDWS